MTIVGNCSENQFSSVVEQIAYKLSMSDAGVRHRQTKNESSPSARTDVNERLREEDDGPGVSLLDVLRIIVTLIAISGAVSYYLTSGESLIWGHKAWYTNPKAVVQYFKGPINLTPEQLLQYDGSDPEKPIYLAINGTIFDVSEGRKTYGPGGSYSVFAGRDATRAFVTGCFLEDRTADMRGAEEVYLPVEDLEDEALSSGEKKTRAERERREARKKVIGEVQNWENFYRNSKKYYEVGKVVGIEDHAGEPPRLCDVAQKGRPKRSKMNSKKAAPGKPVQ